MTKPVSQRRKIVVSQHKTKIITVYQKANQSNLLAESKSDCLCQINYQIDDSAKGSLTQFRELFYGDSLAHPKILNVNGLDT